MSETLKAVIADDSLKGRERIKAITDKLEEGISDLFQSVRYARYLQMLGKFHQYSLNNMLLIHFQMPTATFVAGYTTWKTKFHRYPRKGVHGLKILAPAPYQETISRVKKNPETGDPVWDENGDPVTETIEIKRPAFKVVTVFDVSQTEGKELPTLGVNELSGEVKDYDRFFDALKQSCPVPVSVEAIEGTAKGYFSWAEQRIVIREGMSQIQTIKTMIHEMAHQKLHDVSADESVKEKSRESKEVEAESVAYAVCQYYGIDTSDYSFAYVAGWSADKTLPELKGSLEVLQKTAHELIESIDKAVREREQEHTDPAEEIITMAEAAAKEEREHEVEPEEAIIEMAENAELENEFEKLDQQLEAGKSVEYQVYLESGVGTKRDFATFEIEKQAQEFCENHNWQWMDENEFVWNMSYEEREIMLERKFVPIREYAIFNEHGKITRAADEIGDRNWVYNAVKDFQDKNELPDYLKTLDENGEYLDRYFLYAGYDEYVALSHLEELKPYAMRLVPYVEEMAEYPANVIFKAKEEYVILPLLAEVYYGKQNGMTEEQIDFMLSKAEDRIDMDTIRNIRYGLEGGLSEREINIFVGEDYNVQKYLMSYLLYGGDLKKAEALKGSDMNTANFVLNAYRDDHLSAEKGKAVVEAVNLIKNSNEDHRFNEFDFEWFPEYLTNRAKDDRVTPKVLSSIASKFVAQHETNDIRDFVRDYGGIEEFLAEAAWEAKGEKETTKGSKSKSKDKDLPEKGEQPKETDSIRKRLAEGNSGATKNKSIRNRERKEREER